MKKRLGKIVSSVILTAIVFGTAVYIGSDATLEEKEVDAKVMGLNTEEKINLDNFMDSISEQMMVNNYLGVEYMQEHGGVYENRKTSTGLVYSMDKANGFQCEVIEEGDTANVFFKFGDKVIDSIIMPGMDGTIVEEEWCEFMVPQGITYQDDYFFITAYCSKDNHKSVIYVVNAKSKEYVTTLVRGETGHSGGITIAGGYMWLCDGNNYIRYYDYNKIKKIIRDDLQSIDLSRIEQGTVQIDNRASYCTTHNDLLYIGSFDEKNTNKICIYEPKVNTDKLVKKGEIGELPVNTQGVQFYKIDNREYMLITSSRGRWNAKKYYSRMYIYEIDSGEIDNVVKKLKKTFVLPPMLEEPVIHDNILYLVFESCASTYRKWGASPIISKVCGFDCEYIFK